LGQKHEAEMLLGEGRRGRRTGQLGMPDGGTSGFFCMITFHS